MLVNEYREVLARGVDHLLAQQLAAGNWYAPMYNNSGIEADDLLLREIMGTRTDAITEMTARWLRHEQSTDGSWTDYTGGPGNLSITIEAYLALRIAGDPTSAPHMMKAAGYCRKRGGIQKCRTGTRIWLALLGQIPWESVPVMAPEQLFTPTRSSLSIYGFAVWARVALVPLTIVSSMRPVHPVQFTVPELNGDPGAVAASRSLALRAFAASDKVMQRYHRHPLGPLRRRALKKAEQWVLRHQEADGSWLGVHVLTAFGILALHSLGYTAAHPAMKAALTRFDDFGVAEQLPDGPARRVAVCPGHVWDTALAVIALADAGVPADHPTLTRAAGWLLSQEARAPGDWALERPGLAPSGWPFAAGAQGYPDLDDTAAVLRALQLVEPGDRAADSEQARNRGVAWVLGLQSRAGGWATYETGKVTRLSRLIASLPFNDFGPVLDPPWGGDLTGHVLETLGYEGLAGSVQADRAIQWLASTQEPDGSWYGRWGTNYVYGTSAAVVGLVSAGVDPGQKLVTRAIEWLSRHQNPDGGWGEDCRSYAEPTSGGQGTSTASQTAWGLLALHAIGASASDFRAARALDWLTSRQAPDGSWAEDEYTGVGHPGELFFRYPMYPVAFPLMAIGRYVDATPAADDSTAAEIARETTR
jgi:squalene-hopene/tetraprenyl-beta-curcumene cyclase